MLLRELIYQMGNSMSWKSIIHTRYVSCWYMFEESSQFLRCSDHFGCINVSVLCVFDHDGMKDWQCLRNKIVITIWCSWYCFSSQEKNYRLIYKTHLIFSERTKLKILNWYFLCKPFILSSHLLVKSWNIRTAILYKVLWGRWLWKCSS
jgi:hypothetical protein